MEIRGRFCGFCGLCAYKDILLSLSFFLFIIRGVWYFREVVLYVLLIAKLAKLAGLGL